MSVIQVKVALSRKDLLKAAEQLPTKDLDRFVSDVVALRAQRNGTRASAKERDLLQIINGGFSPEEQERWDELVVKLEDRTLTRAERKELIRMTEEVEQFAVERLEALIQLAKLRKTTVDNLMDEMGLRPRDR